MNFAFSNVEFIRYVFIGAVTSALYFGFSYFLIRVLSIDYQLAASLSYIIAVGFHFFANLRFTFNCEKKDLYIHAKRYIAMMLINYIVVFSILTFLVETMQVEGYIASAISMFVLIFLGFVLSKLWVYSKKGFNNHV